MMSGGSLSSFSLNNTVNARLSATQYLIHVGGTSPLFLAPSFAKHPFVKVDPVREMPLPCCSGSWMRILGGHSPLESLRAGVEQAVHHLFLALQELELVVPLPEVGPTS